MTDKNINTPQLHLVGSSKIEVIDVTDAVVAEINDGKESSYAFACTTLLLQYRSKGGIEALKECLVYLERLIVYIEKRNKEYGNYTPRQN
jgi:hypothetical protein